MKLTDNIYLKELIPFEIYKKEGEFSLRYLDKRIVTALQHIRVRFGKSITINDKFDGGKFDMRGFRPSNTTVGSKTSQHRFGRAADFNIEGLTTQEVYDDIINNQRDYLDYGITRIENIADTPTWTHIDVAWHNKEGLWVVSA